MELLNVVNNIEIKNEINKFGLDNHISEDEVICSIVYEFAKKLPYSIDYMDEDFVPGIFLNVAPSNPKTYIYKYNNSLYDKMINWGDTLKSGILLQICFIFQTMLMQRIPSNYQLSEEDYYNLGISNMTSDKEYNRYLFEMLKSLTEYCARVNLTESTEDRRKVLDEVYVIMFQKIGQKIGGIRRTSIDGDIISIQEHKSTICLVPHRDLDMLYYFNNIRFGFGVERLVKKINIINGLNNEKNMNGSEIDENPKKRMLSL